MDRGWMRKVRDLLRQRRVMAITLVTLLTLGIVGVVVATTTSVGCSLTRSLAVKSKQCLTTPVAIVGSPTPSAGSQPSNFPTPVPPMESSPSSNPPNNPGASSYPPYDPAASPGAVPGSYPPLAGPASGPNTPGVALSCRLPIYAGGPGSGGFIVFPGGTFVADPRSAVTAPSPSPGTASPPPPGYGQGYAGWYGTTFDVKYAKWLPFPGAARQVTAAGFWQGVSHGAAYGTATSAVPQGVANTILKLDLASGAS